MNIERIVLIVLDGVGVGELPDAADFNDAGSNSVSNVAKDVGGLNLPNLQKMGLGNLTDIIGVPPRIDTTGAYGKMAELSKGKDTIIGHWELAGVVSPEPLPVFPNNFPPELIKEFENRINREILGNIHASGTEIINQFGDEHVKTEKPIVYTSVDSVFQIAAHEKIISISELYSICETAREILTGVGRVIARPFLGKSGHYWRTEHRKDFSLLPPEDTLLDKLSKNGYDVINVGKIDDIFAFRGITNSFHTTNNHDTTNKIIELLNSDFHGLLFANLIDFDMVYGHRNDTKGYAQALEEFDKKNPVVQNSMRTNDVLIITSDHGNDPTTPSTDHSREYVPLLVSGSKIRSGIDLGTLSTFADVGASIAEVFGVSGFEVGESFMSKILFH